MGGCCGQAKGLERVWQHIVGGKVVAEGEQADIKDKMAREGVGRVQEVLRRKS